MDAPTCKTCKHSFVSPAGKLVCRRYPPNVQALKNEHVYVLFPVIDPAAICGEYDAAELTLDEAD